VSSIKNKVWYSGTETVGQELGSYQLQGQSL